MGRGATVEIKAAGAPNSPISRTGDDQSLHLGLLRVIASARHGTAPIKIKSCSKRRPLIYALPRRPRRAAWPPRRGAALRGQGHGSRQAARLGGGEPVGVALGHSAAVAPPAEHGDVSRGQQVVEPAGPRASSAGRRGPASTGEAVLAAGPTARRGRATGASAGATTSFMLTCGNAVGHVSASPRLSRWHSLSLQTALAVCAWRGCRAHADMRSSSRRQKLRPAVMGNVDSTNNMPAAVAFLQKRRASARCLSDAATAAAAPALFFGRAAARGGS